MSRASAGAQRASAPTNSRRRGQSLVEFSLVLTPLFLVLLGIIQFGFIFNTYVTMTNAAREGARSGSIYVYERGESKATNDLFRNEAIRGAIRQSMNLLSKSSPQFATTSTWVQSGNVYTNGDLVVTYALPTGVAETDSRLAQTVTVKATYHQDLIVPLVASLLPKDSGGRLGLGAEVTMVIN